MFDRLFRRNAALPIATTALPPAKFAQHAPSPQATADLFQGRWATDLSDVVPVGASGTTRLFRDPRVDFPLVKFSSPSGGLTGQRVLELGPLEGAHTYQLLRHGAEVVAVEANTEAYLKCLIVKELVGLEKARFLYGDCLQYLEECTETFDLIFCCGVLYHMEDPIRLIRQVACRTRRIFLWTHYYTPDAPQYHPHTSPVEVNRDGEIYTYYRRQNTDRDAGRFWGGTATSASMLSRSDLFRAFRQYGFLHNMVHVEELQNPSGPAISASFWADGAI